MAPLRPPLSDSKFTLNAWGVAGIFGGEEAISAMSTIPVYQGRRWLGWYNSPGSLFVARRFGHLPRSAFWRQIFPYTSKSTEALFGFDGERGPEYVAALSGTKMPTGHLGHLAMDKCSQWAEVTKIEGRTTTPAHVTLVELGKVDLDHAVLRLSHGKALLAIFPIIISIATCVMCAYYHDWYSFSVILIGIIAGGTTSIVLGSRKLSLHVCQPAKGAPPGHGVLVPRSPEEVVVVVKGEEEDVNAITKGKFVLELGNVYLQHAVGVCSLLLVIEFLAQLLLIPQGSLFGQIMFATSLCVSWVYNFHISSYRREDLQADVLFSKLGHPKVRKFHTGTRTTMVTLLAILLFDGVDNPRPDAVKKILNQFLPNDTHVWETWKEKVAMRICHRSPSYLQVDGGDVRGFTMEDLKLLDTLLSDSQSAFVGFSEHHRSS